MRLDGTLLIGNEAGLLRLRGGATLATPLLPPHFGHSVLLGLCANTAAIMLLQELRSRRAAACPRWQALLHDSLCTFAAYLIVFLLTGFMPMGYIAGSQPLSWFKLHLDGT